MIFFLTLNSFQPFPHMWFCKCSQSDNILTFWSNIKACTFKIELPLICCDPSSCLLIKWHQRQILKTQRASLERHIEHLHYNKTNYNIFHSITQNHLWLHTFGNMYVTRCFSDTRHQRQRVHFRGNKNMSIDSIAQIQYHFHEDFQSPTPLGWI